MWARPTLLARLSLAWSLACALAASGAAAWAQAGGPPADAGGGGAGFGALGQIAISQDLQLLYFHRTSSGASFDDLVLRPSADYFLAPWISVGVTFGVEHHSVATVASTSETDVVFEAHGTYALRLLDNLALWPRAGFGYTHQSFGGAAPDTGYIVAFDLSAPLLWFPAPHFFVGLGPALVLELAHNVAGVSEKTNSFGLQSLVGGYF